MKTLEECRQRFMSDEADFRLGGIAANLARVASFASNPANRQAILDMLEESKWFIEWTAPSEKPERAARLAEIQLALTVMGSRLNRGVVDLTDISESAARMSDEIMDMSGLLD